MDKPEVVAITAADDEFHPYGYLVRGGRYGLLVDGNRRCEFDPEMVWMRKIWLEATDEHGRELSAVGELVSHHGDRGQGTGYFRWEWDGASGYGEDQSGAHGELLQALKTAAGCSGRPRRTSSPAWAFRWSTSQHRARPPCRC